MRVQNKVFEHALFLWAQDGALCCAYLHNVHKKRGFDVHIYAVTLDFRGMEKPTHRSSHYNGRTLLYQFCAVIHTWPTRRSATTMGIMEGWNGRHTGRPLLVYHCVLVVGECNLWIIVPTPRLQRGVGGQLFVTINLSFFCNIKTIANKERNALAKTQRRKGRNG